MSWPRCRAGSARAAPPAAQSRADPRISPSGAATCRRSPASTPPSTGRQPALAQAFRLAARARRAPGVRRYGFHGLSYEFIVGRLRRARRPISPGRADRRPSRQRRQFVRRRTTATASRPRWVSPPLDGLLMGTRCGALDPGVLLYLLQEKRWMRARVEDLLYRNARACSAFRASRPTCATLLASDRPAARRGRSISSSIGSAAKSARWRRARRARCACLHRRHRRARRRRSAPRLCRLRAGSACELDEAAQQARRWSHQHGRIDRVGVVSCRPTKN